MKTTVRVVLRTAFFLTFLRITIHAQPVVVSDIPNNSSIFRSIGNYVYFTAGDGLWRTDGTKGGTILLRSGLNQIQSHFGTAFQGDFYFVNSNSSELWRSDGTRAGTILLKTFSGNNISFLRSTEQYLFFSASDGSTGVELYRTNGTRSGTVMVKDLMPGSGNGFRGRSAVVGNSLFFAGNDGIRGTELWKSDGTQAGTVMVEDINGGDGDGFAVDPFVSSTVVNDRFYFLGHTPETGNEPWVSDGTSEGTFLLKDIKPGADSSGIIIYEIAHKGVLYFFTLDQFDSGPIVLWKTAGTPSSSVRIETINPSEGLLEFPTSFVYQDKVYFSLHRTSGIEDLWATDGTPQGTSIKLNAINVDGTITYFPNVNDYILFTGSIQDAPMDFFRTNGTQAGTKAFARFKASAYGVHPRSFRTIGDLVFFADHDGPSDVGQSGEPFSHEDYYHLYQTDGITTQSMRTLWGVNTMGTDNVFDHQGKVMFTTQNDQFGSTDQQKKLWIYDPAKQPPPTARFMLVDALTDQDLRRLLDGTSLGSFGTSINIRYEPVRKSGSVVFAVNGRNTRTENTAPYSLAGDASGNYVPWTGASPGIYSLKATAYSERDGRGTILESLTITFRIECPEHVVDCMVTGGVARELWTGISGNTVSVIPFSKPADHTSFITNFEVPANSGANYGARMSGYIIPPVTGEYRFWIASDDYSQLSLSTDSIPENKRRIAFVSGFTMPRQWNKFASQRSSPILLTQGTKYYIEALHKEGIGSDHIAVGWQLPDGTLERPIPARRLSPFERNNAATNFIADEPVRTDGTSYSSINIYPNPAMSGNHQFTVTGFENIKETINADVEIINMTGEVVFRERFSCGGECNTYDLRVSELPPGIYLVNVAAHGARHSKRLLVK